MRYIHLFVFFVNTFIAVLPVMFGEWYGGLKGHIGGYACSLAEKDESDASRKEMFSWYIATLIFPCILLGLTGVIVVLYLNIHVQRRYANTEVGTLMSKLIAGVSGYPVGMAAFWVPFQTIFILSTAGNIIIGGSNLSEFLFFNGSYIFAYQFGLYMAVMFFVKSKEARQRWMDTFKNICCVSLEEAGRSVTNDDLSPDFDEDDVVDDRLSRLSSASHIIDTTKANDEAGGNDDDNL